LQIHFAASVNFYCQGCNNIAKLEAEVCDMLGENGHIQNNHEDNIIPSRYARKHLVVDYTLNLKMVLAMQQLGQGMTGTAVVGGLLSICDNQMNGS
jgi:hypothetical protein